MTLIQLSYKCLAWAQIAGLKKFLMFFTHLAVPPAEKDRHCVAIFLSVSWLLPPACQSWRRMAGMVIYGASNVLSLPFNLLQTTCQHTWRGRLYMVRVASGNLPGSLGRAVWQGMLLPSKLGKACVFHL